MIAFHKDIIRLRRENDELRNGSIKQIDSERNYLAYARFHARGQSVILINNSREAMTKEVSVWEAGIGKEGNMISLLQTTREGYSLERNEYQIQFGKMKITLPPYSGTILKAAAQNAV